MCQARHHFSMELHILHFNICTASKPCLLRTYPVGTSTNMRHCIHSFSGIPVHIGKAAYLQCSVDPIWAILEVCVLKVAMSTKLINSLQMGSFFINLTSNGSEQELRPA